MARGRPRKEFDKKTFEDLCSLGCSQEEICWFFRDEKGKPANIDTLSRWCVRTYKMTFQEYFKKTGLMGLKIKLRRNLFKLSEKSASMAIFLGKQYLGQIDDPDVNLADIPDDGFTAAIKGTAADDWSGEDV